MSGAIVALIAGALLADAAVETVASGSPVRWWAVGAAVSYAIAAAATWRRSIGWRGRVTTALVILLGVVAVTAWLRGGLTEGIRVAGQPTTRVLAALIAAGVAVGCITVLRERTIPLVIRVVFAALACYGAAAFAIGAIGRVPLAALLSGASVWQRLPAVFQGAFAGGLLVLPVALVASLVRAGLRRPRDASAHAELWRLTAIATSLAIVLAAIPWPFRSRAGTPPGDVTAGSTFGSSGSSGSATDLNAALANSLRAVEDGERDGPRDRWDPAYVVSKLGTDPLRLFTWVGSNTFWIPYRGLLRGPVGVLMDRLGNSLDRAMLLATLQRQANHNARLAHGSLSRDQAMKLLPRLLVARARMTPAVTAPPDDYPFAAVAGQYHLDEASLRRTLSSQAETQAKRRALLQARVPDQTRRLVAEIGHEPTDRTRAILDRAIDALQDHWWVQVREGDSWRDFDLLARDGGALVSPNETIDLDAVPNGLRHEVRVRVVVEQWAGGALTEHVALEQAVRPAELIGSPVTLQFIPFRAPTQPPLASLDSAQALRAAALDVHEWVPALIVGDRQIMQSAILDTGDLTKPGAEDLVKQAGRDSAGFASAANDLFHPGAPAAPPSQSAAPSRNLTATWIDYEIRTPGAPPETIRRTVFDLIGQSIRAAGGTTAPALGQPAMLTRSLALMMGTEILPLVCRVAPRFVAHLAAQGMLANRDALATVVRGDFVDDYAHAQEVAKRLAPMPTPLYGLARARFEWSRFGDAVFVDRLNILTRHVFLTPASGGFKLRTATDVVSNDVGVDPLAPDPFAIRLEQGVLDTNAEAILAADAPDSTNAGWAFESAATWETLRSRDDPQLARLQLTEDVRHRIGDDLAAGYIVIAPDTPVRVGAGSFSGWWHVDPVTGHALGIGENGWGNAIPERAAIMLTVGSTTFLFTYLWCKMGEGGPSAALRCEPSRDLRATALDFLIAPLNAAGSDCLWTALNWAFAAAAIAGLGPIFGGAAAAAGARGGTGAGRGGAGGAGAGADAPPEINPSGDPPNAGQGTGRGSGAGRGDPPPESGGSGGGGSETSGSAASDDDAALEEAWRRAWEAEERGDDRGFTEAIRDMARINTRDNPKLNRLIPPQGEPPGREWYVRPQTSPGAQSVRPCDLPDCAPGPSPMAKSVGGASGAIDLLKTGKQ